MKRTIAIFTVLSALLLPSCEDLNNYNCNECLDSMPDMCDLEIKLPDSYSDPASYHVRVYMGKIEDEAIIDDRWSSSSFAIPVFLNQEYTVMSTREDNGITYTAIDATTPKVKYDTDYCEVECFFIIDNRVDVRFKY